MRKSEKKWKIERDNRQTRLFVGPENAPNQPAPGGTGDAAGGVMDLLSRLAEQRTLTEHLLERIVDYKNLKPMVRTNGATINSHRNDAVKTLAETAVIRSTYVRWCGGTAAKAASYPISKKTILFRGGAAPRNMFRGAAPPL